MGAGGGGQVRAVEDSLRKGDRIRGWKKQVQAFPFYTYGWMHTTLLTCQSGSAIDKVLSLVQSAYWCSTRSS